MFVFYGVKSRKEAEIFRNKYNFCLYYEDMPKIYLRYGMATGGMIRIKGFSKNKNLYIGQKGMECIDFEDFIKFIK